MTSRHARAPGSGARASEAMGQEPSTRDLILDAAERRFAEHGYAGVAVREIAAEAGLKNQASLYHHFRNKRAIYEAVLARGIEPLVRIVTSLGVKTTSRGGEVLDAADVVDLLDCIIDYLLEHPYLPLLVQRAGLDEARYLRKALRRHMTPLYEYGLRMLTTVDSHWAPEELPHVAAGFSHLIFGYFADASTLEGVIGADLCSPEAIARERRVLKTAARRLLGVRTATSA